MHLKSLTLRGFKSFASSTTLHFEPGITCVVGPNGSGKSNVVDALAWVMGEQGAKTLRGGSMQDVIFAGTSGRPPLGRAEVQLTIDNADGTLPVDYTEVTIARTMFRSGGSEYAINGQPCRLLDVQELLSDSGIGREMHVVVGQGRLDAILQASPEERRGFIEEAAGVLKHRKRKEKALRKLDATGTNITRLLDLLAEIRRQLKPLGRQADVAQQASVVQADARDARARLLADDLAAANAALHQELASESALRERRAAVEAQLAQARTKQARLEEALRGDTPRVTRAQDTWYQLCSLRERLRGTASLAAERQRFLGDEAVDERSGRDPAALSAEAEHAAQLEDAIATEVVSRRLALDQAVTARRAAEAAHVEEERRVNELLRSAADRREGVAQLSGEVQALRSRASAATEEQSRLVTAREEALARAERARRAFTALETTVAGLDAGEHGLDAEHEAAQAALAELGDRLSKAREEAEAAERERTALAARHEALTHALAGKDGAAALLSSEHRVPDVLGSLATLVRVQPGYEAAISAALGPVAEAVVVRDLDAATEVLAHLKVHQLGRAGMLPETSGEPAGSSPSLPAGARWAAELVQASPGIQQTLRRLLRHTAVVEDLAAQELLAARPELVAVTRDGDLIGRYFAAGGSSAGPTAIEVRAAVEETNHLLSDAHHRCERLRFELTRLDEERAAAGRRADVALAKLHESDAALAAVAEELGQLGSLARAATDEAQRVAHAIAAATAARDRELDGLAELEHRLTNATAQPAAEPGTAELDRLTAAARAARQSELEARLALRTTEERARGLRGRADALARTAQQERDLLARAAARRERRAAAAVTAQEVGHAARAVLARLDASLQQADAERAAAEQARDERDGQLTRVSGIVRDLGAELDKLTDSVHRDELARAEQRMRIEQLEQRAVDELGLDAHTLAEDFGPDQPIPPSPGAAAADGDDAPAAPVRFVRTEQEARLRTAERALALLGKVNPLALEEFSALEERHKYLTEQLDDLKRTRAHLLDIVREVDERVTQVLAEAFADTAREFTAVFARLFPGGEGQLLLTEPGDVLASGVEVEARPAGKRVKRLSLLSGGERSLVAVAFLVALFKARPSPFYVLDEVEAALDDTNLGRLLDIYTELRESSQLLVVTHQKRTMGIADALYGVSMRDDGVSTVIGQRLREAQPA